SGGSDDAGGPASTNAADTSSAAGAGAGADCDWSIEAPSTNFVVDRCGRALILRGINVESSSKAASQDDDHFPRSDPGLQEMFGSEWGWNTVRFLVFWGAIEPEQ